MPAKAVPQARKPKHVAILTSALAYGGAEVQLVRLALALKARGWQVDIVMMLPSEAFVGELKAQGVGLHCLEMQQGLSVRGGLTGVRGLARAVKVLRQLRPDLLVSFNFPGNALGRVAGRLAGVPIIVSSIRNEFFGGARREQFMRLTGSVDAATTTNSQLAADSLVRRGIVQPSKLHLTPNGLTEAQFQTYPAEAQQLRRALGVTEDTFLWVAVGRLEPQKAYPNLFRALKQLVEDRNTGQVALLVAGQGRLYGDLEALITSLGLGEQVRLLGLRKDVPVLLSAADAFVLASSWEGLPNVLMEALAAATPAVATTVGGVEELLQAGETGYTAPPDDPEALAEAMRRMMAHSTEKRAAMGRKGQAFIRERYGLEWVMDIWEGLFVALLEQKSLT